MNWRIIPILLAVLAPCGAGAETRSAALPAAGVLCRQAISAAERSHGIPAHLLAAIARVESGRRDQGSGTFNPWPWTINMDGQGSFYDTKPQAVAAAMSMRPRASKSVDVGCMQISLMHHPNAFASMEQAFDPAANTDYGARYLVQLFGKTHSWPKAVALYHSATDELGDPYQRLVYAAWPEEQKLASVEQPLAAQSLAAQSFAAQPSALAHAWAATVNHSLVSSVMRPSAPRVIPLAAGLDGAVPAGRSLAAYRAAPVRLAFRGF